MAPLEISLNGQGTSIHAAERAILSLNAQSEQLTTQAAASEVVTSTANALRDIIMPFCPQDEATGRTLPDAPIVHYSMSTLDTTSHPYRDTSNNIIENRYSARAEFKIKFQDFGVLNNLATRFSAMQNVKISRIDWSLTDVTSDSIKGGARKRAAQDAIQRAWDYAAVFADIAADDLKRKVRPVSVNEQGFYQQGTRPQLHYGKGMRGRPTTTEELQFEPEDVRLDVTVNTKFVVDV
jgi:uncharacterized protein YggE